MTPGNHMNMLLVYIADNTTKSTKHLQAYFQKSANWLHKNCEKDTKM